MISSEFKKPQLDQELAGLINGLRGQGLGVMPEDASRLAHVFQHSATWSHPRRVRALKALLARTERERAIIDRIAPLLFLHAEKDFPLEEPEAAQTRSPLLNRSVAAQKALLTSIRVVSGRAVGTLNRVWWANRRGLFFAFVGLTILLLLLSALFFLWNIVSSTSAPVPITPPNPTTTPESSPLDVVLLQGLAIKSLGVAAGFALFYLLLLRLRTWYKDKNVEAVRQSRGPRSYLLDLPERQRLPLDPQRVRTAAFQLSAPSLPISAPWLDPLSTVEETVTKAGYLTLCYDSQRTQQPVLFVEDVSPSMARWPDMGTQIFQSLIRQGGGVFHLYMAGDPTTLFSNRDLSRGYGIEEVVGRYQSSRFVVLSDGVKITPPRVDYEPAWLRLLEDSVWLHPGEAESWRSGARWLADHTCIVAIPSTDFTRLERPSRRSSALLPSAWRPPAVLIPSSEARLQALRVALGEDVFWWLAIGALLSEAGGLSARVMWSLYRNFFHASPRVSLNRLWKVNGLNIGGDGRISYEHEFRAALIERLQREKPSLSANVVSWAEGHILEDLERLDKHSLASVEARAFHARLLRAVPSRKADAQRHAWSLTNDGFGDFLDDSESEPLRQERELDEGPSRKTSENSLRDADCLVLGPTGSGKTAFLLALSRVAILEPFDLEFSGGDLGNPGPLTIEAIRKGRGGERALLRFLVGDNYRETSFIEGNELVDRKQEFLTDLRTSVVRSLVLCIDSENPRSDLWRIGLPRLLFSLNEAGVKEIDRILLVVTKVDLLLRRKPFHSRRLQEQRGRVLSGQEIASILDGGKIVGRHLLGLSPLTLLQSFLKPRGQLAVALTSSLGFDKNLFSREPEEALRSWDPYGLQDTLHFLATGETGGAVHPIHHHHLRQPETEKSTSSLEPDDVLKDPASDWRSLQNRLRRIPGSGPMARLVRLFRLDIYGVSLLTRSGGLEMKYLAALLVVVFLFCSALWALLINSLVHPFPWTVSFKTPLALMGGYGLGVFNLLGLRRIVIQDTSAGVFKKTVLFSSALILILVSSSVLVLPALLALIREPVAEQIRSEAIQAELVRRAAEIQASRGDGTQDDLRLQAWAQKLIADGGSERILYERGLTSEENRKNGGWEFHPPSESFFDQILVLENLYEHDSLRPVAEFSQVQRDSLGADLVLDVNGAGREEEPSDLGFRYFYYIVFFVVSMVPLLVVAARFLITLELKAYYSLRQQVAFGDLEILLFFSSKDRMPESLSR